MSTADVLANGDQPPRDEHEVRREAIAWYVRLCSGEATDADRRAWEQWHRHPDHQRAWQRIESIRQSTQRVPAHIAAPTLQAPAKGRRRALKSILLVASTGSLAYVAYRGASDDGVWRSWVAEYRTGVGERRSVMLTDGSRLTLNTDTAVDVSYDATHRLVHLWTGEILIETARDALYADTQGRPFVVETAHGSMRALGTRFTVRMHGARTDVAVLADAVEIRASDLPASPIILQAGQRASFTRSHIEMPRPADDSMAAWEHGSLVVDDWRLGDVIAELDRYRPGRLSCDPAVAGIRISGAFPITDTDKALAVITKSFPVRVTRFTRFWVGVRPL